MILLFSKITSSTLFSIPLWRCSKIFFLILWLHNELIFLENSDFVFNISIPGCVFQFRVQQMWFRNLFPWHIILHLFAFKLKDLLSLENLKVSLQTSTPRHWWKCWMKLILTAIYGESISDPFPPRKWTCFALFNLISNQKNNFSCYNLFLLLNFIQRIFQIPNILSLSYLSYPFALPNFLK